ncbi:TRAP transporter small permease subunit [Nisaea sp.]|uniref:TRAP transporter small permease subunit n=1 Tax=Nisaea sp. TaxID=2024842 RepID=UPI003B525600
MDLLETAKKAISVGGAVAALIFLPGLILVSIVDVTGRRFLQFSSTPLQELASQLFFASVMFGIGYTYIKDRHVRVDILRERVSARLKARLEQVMLIALFLPLCLILLWFGVRMTWLSFVQDEGSRAALGLSARWIIKSVLPIGSLLLFLAGCYRLANPAVDGDDA